MTHRMMFMLVFLLALCVSAIGVFAQENDNSTPGETEVLAFFNNLGANVQRNSNDIPEVNTNEPNWCTQSNRWGDGRCNNTNSWVHRYNWYIGWILAHCEIPDYFSIENWPEVCEWGLNASPDEVYRTLFPSASTDDNNDNGSVIILTEPTEATPTEATPTEATPTEATPTEATPTEATPTEVTPTEATPTETTPTEPTPTEATPTEVTPTEATPTEPTNAAPNASIAVNCVNLVCIVNAGGSVDSDGTIVSYAWDFGDSGTGSSVTTPHTYAAAGNYTITLIVTDDDGATGQATKTVVVVAPNIAPTASFTFSCTNLVCNFNGSATDADGSIVSYAWSFGATGSTASNTFASAGTYSVTLTVTDNYGATATSTQNVTVSATTDLSASYTCSGTDIIVVITSGDAPFTISGGGQPVSAQTIGSYPIGTRNGNITVTETGGNLQSIALGNKLCQP